jgi:hypothetical protein
MKGTRGVNLTSRFFAIVSENVVSDSFRVGLAMVQVRINGALAPLDSIDIHRPWLDAVFSFVAGHPLELLPPLALFANEGIQHLMHDLRPFELFQPIIQTYVVEANADSIAPYWGYLSRLQEFVDLQKDKRQRSWVGLSDGPITQLLFGLDRESAGLLVQVSDPQWTAFEIVDDLLRYRGARQIGCPPHMGEHERYQKASPDSTALLECEEFNPFETKSLRPAIRTDFLRGDLARMTRRNAKAHAWALEWVFRQGDNAFREFFPAGGGTWNVSGNHTLKLLSWYVVFSSIFFDAAAHWRYIEQIVDSGSSASNRSEFSEFLTDSLRLVCLHLVNRATAGSPSEAKFASLGLNLPRVDFTFSTEIIDRFDGTRSDAEFWDWLDGNNVCEHIGEKTTAPALDFSGSILDWVRRCVLASADPADFFDRDRELGWFFDIGECLLIRQLYSVLAHGRDAIPGSRSWAILTWLLDSYGGGPPDISGTTAARFFWNQFRDFALSEPGEDPIKRIRTAMNLAYEVFAAKFNLSHCTSWTLIGEKVGSWTAKGNASVPVPMPPLIDRVVYSLAMFHSFVPLTGEKTAQLGRLFGFLRALPRVHMAKHLPVIADLAWLLKCAFRRQFNLAYVFLSLCSTCAEIAVAFSSFTEIGLLSISPDRLALLREALMDIDACTQTVPTAYARISVFMQAAIAAHNDALMKAPNEEVPFASVTSETVFAYINTENTLLQVMAKAWFEEPDLELDFVGVGLRMADELEGVKEQLWFGDSAGLPRRIAGYPAKRDIFGFDEEIFRRSLSKVKPAKPHMRALLENVVKPAREKSDANCKSSPIVPEEAALPLAIAMLQEIDDEGPAGLDYLLTKWAATKCERSPSLEGNRWQFFARGLAGEEKNWTAGQCWTDAFLRKLDRLLEQCNR